MYKLYGVSIYNNTEVKNKQTSQYWPFFTPLAYALLYSLSVLRALQAALSWAIGCMVCGKLLSMVTTWLGTPARLAHSYKNVTLPFSLLESNDVKSMS